MECPVCTRPALQEEEGGELKLWCPACGWGTGDRAAEPAPTEHEPVAWWQLTLWWAASVLVIVGPYMALRYGVPNLLNAIELGAISGGLQGLNTYYAWGMVIYLATAALLTPTYDPENVGFLGGLIDNPFSFQDDFERMKRTLLFVLLPGKIVWWTLGITWDRIRS